MKKFCVAEITAPVGEHLHLRDYVRHPPHFNWSSVHFTSLTHANQNSALNSGAAITITHPVGAEPNPYRITLTDSHGLPLDVVSIHVVEHGKVTPPCHAVASGHAVDVVFKIKPGTKFHIGLAGAVLGLNPDEIQECPAAKLAQLKADEACIRFLNPPTPKRQSGGSAQQNANNFLDALNNGLFDSAGAVPGSGIVSDPNAPAHGTNAPHAPTAPHPTAPHAPTHAQPHTSAPGAVHHLSTGAVAAIIFVVVFLCVAIIVILAVAIVVKRRDRQHLDHF